MTKYRDDEDDGVQRVAFSVPRVRTVFSVFWLAIKVYALIWLMIILGLAATMWLLHFD